MRRVMLTAVAALALLLAAIMGGLLVVLRDFDPAPFVGTTLGGYQPDDSMRFSDWLELERRHFGDQPIRVMADGFGKDLRATELGIEVDVAQMLQVVQRQRRSGSWLRRVQRALAARLHQTDYSWLTRFERDVARAALLALAPAVERAAVDAEVDFTQRRRVLAAEGSKLDVEQTLDFLESHRSVELDYLPLTMIRVPPGVRDEDATGVDVTRVLSQFETDFKTKAGTRAVNIRVAARALQRQIIGPGAVFSFNRVVGPRIEARGYREAPVIVDDEVEPGVGGGVCQVATTLHAAAVLGGLEIIERRSHSRPSGYAPLGLDATVIDGKVDLKLRNPYSVPLGIATSFPQRFRIRVEILGLSPAAKVEHSFGVVKRHDYYRRVVTKSELSPGSFQRKQKGNFGLDVSSTVSKTSDVGAVTQWHYRSHYWPVPEVFWVGPDTDLGVLPVLPPGATGVQLDGVTVEGVIASDVEARSGKSEPRADSLEQ